MTASTTFFDQTQDDVEFFLANRPISLFGGVGVNASGDVTTNSFTTDLNDDTEADIEVFSAYIQDRDRSRPVARSGARRPIRQLRHHRRQH